MRYETLARALYSTATALERCTNETIKASHKETLENILYRIVGGDGASVEVKHGGHMVLRYVVSRMDANGYQLSSADVVAHIVSEFDGPRVRSLQAVARNNSRINKDERDDIGEALAQDLTLPFEA